MRINPAHLLLFILIFVFAPTIHEWITQGGSDWYRPYGVWLGIILYVYWTGRGSKAS